jgi:hypothetical protein
MEQSTLAAALHLDAGALGSVVAAILRESWSIFVDAAPFMLFGFLVAGLIKAFLPDRVVVRHLGGRGLGGAVKASLLGVPLPLCSCGVVPTAAGLRQQGASKGPIAAFLVSTPETGVDSIAVTYALLDPLMTVVRPISAFVTGVVAGVFVGRADRDDEPGAAPTPEFGPAPTAEELAGGCSGGECACAAPEPDAPAKPWPARLRSGLGYAFGELLEDIAGWFLVGTLIAGLIAALAPTGWIEANLGGGLAPMLLMLAVGVPLYVCATSSTPIAAALVLKGLSPGAALVFLLAGPATNAAALAVVGRLLGRRATVFYLIAIMVCALGFGLATDQAYALLGLDAAGWAAQEPEGLSRAVSLAGAALLLLLIARGLLRRLFAKAG